MSKWLADNKLQAFEDVAQVHDVINAILKSATGYSIDSDSQLKNIQKQLLQLFGQLSSYTIQFLGEVNESSIIPLGWSAIRLGNIKEIGHIGLVAHNGVDIIENRAAGSHSHGLVSTVEQTVYATAPSVLESVSISHGVEVSNSTSVTEQQPVFLDAVRWYASYPGYDPIISSNATYIGAEFFEMLTEDQRKQIKSF